MTSSSITSTRCAPSTASQISSLGSTGSDVCGSRYVRGTRIRKVEPCPGTLSTLICPPIISVNCLVIGNPSPVPPYFVVVSSSAWVNSSNTLMTCCSFMPIPVSAISKFSHSIPAKRIGCAVTVTTPSSVNLQALVSKLIKHWRNRVSSPRMPPMSSATSNSMRLLFFDASGSPMLLSTLIMLLISKSEINSSILPASIFDRSKMSLIKPSKCTPESVIFFRSSAMSSRPSSSASSSNNSLYPMIAFNGVRNS